MKHFIRLFSVLGLFIAGPALSADITIYHSPSCPHCHHARDFINGQLIKDFPTVKITEIDVTKSENQDAFAAVLKKCNYNMGGVPVLVIGEKCFQGYADSMQEEIRTAISVDLKNDSVSDENETNSEISEPSVHETNDSASEKTISDDTNGAIYFYGLLLVLLVGLTIIVVKKNKR